MKPLPSDIFRQLNRLYTEFLDPAFNRLPLRGFVFDADEPLITPTDNIHQFIGASERTAELVEELADVVERTADYLESTAVPLAREQLQRLSSVCQLFAHEASLRFLQLQQSWLREFVSDP
ncbi:unnamed protein product [Dicrocoelium dendriticum]|nr:unnamed protein product [Dicrocoelium dendriticum]